MSMRTLSVVNQKGGVGKSTLTVHLAYEAMDAKLRVLLVDLDRQRSLSLSFPRPEGVQPGLVASALFSTDALTAEPEVISPYLSIIRADPLLELLSGGNNQAERLPARHLQSLSDQYDLCLIDTPGAIGFNPPMTVAALIASQAVVCPVPVGLYEAQGLADLWRYLTEIKSPTYNPHLRVLGLVPSKVNTKSPEETAGLADLRESFGDLILPGVLAERSAVKQAIMKRRPVWRNTKGAGHLAAAKEWRSMCNVILGKLGEIR